MPAKYLILRQVAAGRCEVVYYDNDKQTRTVLFCGGRWPARHFLRELRGGVGWENVPAFCEKKAPRSQPAPMVEMTDYKL